MWSCFSVFPVYVSVNLPPLPSTIVNQIKYRIKLIWLYVSKDFLKKKNGFVEAQLEKKQESMDLKIKSGIHAQIKIKIIRKK